MDHDYLAENIKQLLVVFLQVYSQPLNGEPMWPFPVIPIVINGEYRKHVQWTISSLVGVTF